MGEDLTQKLMSEAIRKVFLGALGSVAAVGLFLNYQIAAQGKEIVILKAGQEYMAKRLEAQEATSSELRAMMRSMESSNRGEHEILRGSLKDVGVQLDASSRADAQILILLKELMVLKDQIIEKGMKP